MTENKQPEETQVKEVDPSESVSDASDNMCLPVPEKKRPEKFTLEQEEEHHRFMQQIRKEEKERASHGEQGGVMG